MEDDNANVRLRTDLENLSVVGETERVVLLPQYFADSLLPYRRGLPRLSEANGLKEEVTQETPKEKIDYRTFRERLGIYRGAQEEKEVLQEGEPTLDLGGDGGVVLGTGTKEEIDKTNYGIATNGPKKTLKKFRGDIR